MPKQHLKRRNAYARAVAMGCLAGVLTVAAPAHADWKGAVTDAWNCAKDYANVTLTLAMDGSKAVEVLGTSPQCVAGALAPDPFLLGVSGVMVAVNAADPALLPASSQCVPQLKKGAIKPFATILNSVADGVIPQSYLDATTAEASDQLWTFMSTTPPVSQFVSATECGCTFLEAGISVETVKELVQTIGKAGKSCDAFLNNVPGYQEIKAVAGEAAYQANNYLEGVFVDQSQHKPVEDYYLYDFGGHPQSAQMVSHAVQWALNPAHDPANAEGAQQVFDRFFHANKGATRTGYVRNYCEEYFDSHTMSTSNAQKVCNGMRERFKTESLALSKQFIARDALFSKAKSTFEPMAAAAKEKCTPAPYNEDVRCKEVVNKVLGSMYAPSPYAQQECSTLYGNCWTMDKVDVNKMISGASEKFYLLDYNSQETYGIYRSASDLLRSLGWDATKALKVAKAQFQTQLDLIVDNHQKQSAILKAKYEKEQFEKMVNDAVAAIGMSYLEKCPSTLLNQCGWNMFTGWQQCEKWSNALFTQQCGEFLCPKTAQEQSTFYNTCIQKVRGLPLAFSDWNNNSLAEYGFASAVCQNHAGQDQEACLKENWVRTYVCMGGLPEMGAASSSITGAYTQKPAPLSKEKCQGLTTHWEQKWSADETQLQSLSTTAAQATQSCATLTTGTQVHQTCVNKVEALRQYCEQEIRTSYDLMIPGRPFYSDDYASAMVNFLGQSKRCIRKVTDQATAVVQQFQAQQQAVTQYSAQCPPNDRITGTWQSKCETAVSNATSACIAAANLKLLSSGQRVGASLRVPTTTSADFNLGNVTFSLTNAGSNLSLDSLLSSPISQVQTVFPTAFEVGLYDSTAEVLSACASDIQKALVSTRTDYLAAYGVPYMSTMDEVNRYLTARSCSSSTPTRGGYNYTCVSGSEGNTACPILKNAAAPGVLACATLSRVTTAPITTTTTSTTTLSTVITR